MEILDYNKETVEELIKRSQADMPRFQRNGKWK